MGRLVAFGAPQEVAGDYLFRSGDRDYDLILVDSGEVEIVRDSLGWVDEAVIATMGPRTFVGELGLLNGQGAFLSARASRASRMLPRQPGELRRLMAEDDELCDIVLHALWARREIAPPRTGRAHAQVRRDRRSSRDFLALRRFAERLDLVHTAVELGRPASSARPRTTRPHASPTCRSPSSRASRCRGRRPGWSPSASGSATRRTPTRSSISSSSAAVRPDSPPRSTGRPRASSTVLLDAVAPGRAGRGDVAHRELPRLPVRRQRRRPHRPGLAAGAEVRRARLRAVRGRRPRPVGDDARHHADRRPPHPHAQRRSSPPAPRTARLDLERWSDFEGAGIYYAATPLELRQVLESPVVVVGGANSAGQASLYLAANGCPVHLVVRGCDLGTRMSSYLVDRLLEDPRVEVHTGVSASSGSTAAPPLERVHIDSSGDVDARGLFCFIGADPATSWLADARPRRRRVPAHRHRRRGRSRSSSGRRLGREPLPFETSMPRVFAAGDVRRGSMKRVAAAVGEGSSAVASVHRALAG